MEGGLEPLSRHPIMRAATVMGLLRTPALRRLSVSARSEICCARGR